MLKIFKQVDVYINEPIKIDEQFKLANQLIQRRTRDRNGKDNNNSYFWKHIDKKIRKKNYVLIKKKHTKEEKKHLFNRFCIIS